MPPRRADLHQSRPALSAGVVIHDPVHIADGVTLTDSEIGPNVTISKGSKISGSVLRDTIIGEGASLSDCRLHDSLVGNFADLRGVTGTADVGDHSVVNVADGASS